MAATEHDQKQPLTSPETCPYSVTKPPAPLSVAVSSSRTVQAKKPYTVYVLLVKWPNEAKGDSGPVAWTTPHRFSEFEALHNRLSNMVSGANLPSLPPKTWWRTLDPSFVSKRQKQLHDYMQQLLAVPAVLQTIPFQQFLEVEQNCPLPDRNLYLPTKCEPSVDDTMFGIADFVFDPTHSPPVLLTACEECGLLSKIDAKISNLRFPWEEKGIVTPTGSFTVGLQEAGKWTAVHSEYYESAALCVAWDPVRQYAFVGLGNGFVHTYYLDLEEKKITQVSEKQVHADRITALVYDNVQDILITTGHDKLLNILDVKAQNEVKATDDSSTANLTCLAIHPTDGYGLVGTYSRKLVAYDFTAVVKTLSLPFGSLQMHLLDLTGHSGSICCVALAPQEGYAFSGDSGHQIGIWNVGKTRQSFHRARAVGWLSGGPPSRVQTIVFVASMNIVFAGHSSGMVAVWDVLQGKLLYCFEAHSRAVVKITWREAERTLLTAGQDGFIHFWQVPMCSSRNVQD